MVERHDKEKSYFQYWDTILTIEIYILVFVRAHQEKNFSLYVEALEKIVGFFFAFDHYNYQGGFLFIYVTCPIPSSIKQDFIKNWVVSKSQHRFSSIPIDQAHEQLNAVVKGKEELLALLRTQLHYSTGYYVALSLLNAFLSLK